MHRYSEVVIRSAGLGEMVLYRARSQSYAASFRRTLGALATFSERPSIREVITPRPKPLGRLVDVA